MRSTPWWFLPAVSLVAVSGAVLHETVVWPWAMAHEDWPLAERIARDRLEARRTWLGPDAWWTGRGWYTLAWIVDETDPDAALPLADEALRIFEGADPGHRRTARAYELRGVTAAHAGDLEAAERDHLAALRIREALDPWDEEAARSYTNLAIVAHQRGDDAEVERRLRRARQIRRAAGTARD